MFVNHTLPQHTTYNILRTMNQPNSEPTQFPNAAKPAMSSACEKCSTRSDMDPRRNRLQHEMESTTVLPPPNYRYPRRGGFTHSDLLRSAVIASIESSRSCDDDCNVKLFDLTLKYEEDQLKKKPSRSREDGKPSHQKRSRSLSDMEEGPDSTEIAFISKSVDMQSLSIRLPDHLSTSPRRVSLPMG
jgi:hypothetical protein